MLPLNMFQKVAITEYSQKAKWLKLPPKLLLNKMNVRTEWHCFPFENVILSKSKHVVKMH